MKNMLTRIILHIMNEELFLNMFPYALEYTYFYTI